MSTTAELPSDVRALYPFAPHWLETPMGRIHYVDEGPRDADTAVICVHGNPTWSFMYRELVQALSPRVRVIAPDHLGCGVSDKPENFSYRLADHIENLARLVEKIEQPKLHFIVHDWGGPIGLAVAERFAERVDKLVILNTAAFHGPLPRRIALCRMPILGPLLVRGANGFAHPAIWMAVTQTLPAAVKHGYLWPYGNWCDRIAIMRFVEDIPMAPNHPSLGTLRAVEAGLEKLRGKPMLLGWGMRDFCFTPHYLREWQRRFPEAVVKEYPDAGHYVLEDAKGELLPEIAEFLLR